MTPSPSVRGSAAARVAVVVCVLGLAAACAAPAEPIPSTVLDGVTLELRQARADWAARVVQVRVDNGSAGGLEVVAARLESSPFGGAVLARPGVLVAPGAPREVSFPLGEAQHVFYVPAGDELRGRLRAFVGEHCGWGEAEG